MKLIHKARSQKRGAALVEYGLIVAGVALVAAAAVSIFGHKTTGMIGAAASAMPGAQAADNAPISAGRIMDTTVNANGVAVINPGQNNSLGNNLGLNQTQVDNLVRDPNTSAP